MAKRKRRKRRARRASEDAITAAALNAAARLETRPDIGPMVSLVLTRRKPKAVARLRQLVTNPRQVRLNGHEKRVALVRALELSRGKPIGRVTRAKLRDQLPHALAEAMCERKRERREVMFARGSLGAGKRVRRERDDRVGRC